MCFTENVKYLNTVTYNSIFNTDLICYIYYISQVFSKYFYCNIGLYNMVYKEC
jgi:hypothetical protein